MRCGTPRAGVVERGPGRGLTPAFTWGEGGCCRTKGQLLSLPQEVGVGWPAPAVLVKLLWADWVTGYGFPCQVPTGPLLSQSLH